MGEETKRRFCIMNLSNLLTKVEKHPEISISTQEAKTYLQRCEDFMQRCEEAQQALLNLCVGDEAIQVQFNAFEPAERIYCQVKSKLNEIIFSSTQTGGGSGGGSTGTHHGAYIKLPALELPSFDGTYANWPSFKDLFQATVDSNTHLAPAQKLQYLKSSLKGEPSNLIRALSITDSHYEEAKKILNDRYDNTREIVSALITKLLQYKPLQSENAHEQQKLIDNTQECLSALKVLKQPVQHWDTLLVVLHITKLDSTTKREWAIRQQGSKFPTFEEFNIFITNHIRGLQAASATPHLKKPIQPVRVHHTSTSSTGSCIFCKGPHPQHRCNDYISKDATQRLTMVKGKRLCTNCLRPGHQNSDCKSAGTCFKCNQRHHTSLHHGSTARTSHPQLQPSTTNSTQALSTPQDMRTYHMKEVMPPPLTQINTEVLLPTALCNIRDRWGATQPCRIFLDQGSQATLITEECVQRLKLPRDHNRSTLTGAFFTKGSTTKGRVNLLICNNQSEIIFEVQAHVTPRFTGNLPNSRLHQYRWNHLNKINLADPKYNIPAPVDILLGAEYVALLKIRGKKVGPPQAPIAENTLLGWILSGRVQTSISSHNTIHHISSLDSIVRRFWETEEPPTVRTLTKQEKLCETDFLSSYRRDATGRFIVGIPFNERKHELGLSRGLSIRRLLQVEKRLQQHPHHRQQYIEFMREYETLGHMERISTSSSTEVPGQTYYLPHHFVVNSSSTTTKLRVVFDGSAKTSTGISLNETLLVGPTVQQDIYDLLLRFRTHKYVLKADITKMFRQFYLRNEDMDFHRIVWREGPDCPIQDFRLRTVTYGTACAPYLSTRCLQQLALDVRNTLPAASKALHDDCYVDDLMSGAETLEELTLLYTQLTEATNSASLELRKWASNNTTFLDNIPSVLREMVGRLVRLGWLQLP